MKTKHLMVAAAVSVLAAANIVTIAIAWEASKPKHVAELYPSDALMKHIQHQTGDSDK